MVDTVYKKADQHDKQLQHFIFVFMYMQLSLQSISARPTVTKVKIWNPRIAEMNVDWNEVRVDVQKQLLSASIEVPSLRAGCSPAALLRFAVQLCAGAQIADKCSPAAPSSCAAFSACPGGAAENENPQTSFQNTLKSFLSPVHHH